MVFMMTKDSGTADDFGDKFRLRMVDKPNTIGLIYCVNMYIDKFVCI